MKRIFGLLAALAAAPAIFAGTGENFNSRPGIALTQLKGYLQDKCWRFADFAVNNGGWNPGIEGDGAMVSGPGSGPQEQTGIYSQPLNIGRQMELSFKYSFSSAVTQRRWMRLSLLGEEGSTAALLDSLELTGAAGGKIYHYNNVFTVKPGVYTCYINYRGIGGNTRMAVDELLFSAPCYYHGGCNLSPVAGDDYVDGKANHSATGNVLRNDYDPQQGLLAARLVTNSPDGQVILKENGDFSFTPRPDFTGTSTSFKYLVSNNGTPALCSAPATVTIRFAKPMTAANSVTDFSASYSKDRVVLAWSTAAENPANGFDIERSTDGINFKAAGHINPPANIAHDYVFEDAVKARIVGKKDLYYRLKQVDENGSPSYSKMLVVRVYQTHSLQSVSVTPNPAVNDIRVNVDLNENAFVVMKVTNNSGIELMRRSGRCNSGANSFTLQGTGGLQGGVYFLELIVNSNERMMVKLVKS